MDHGQGGASKGWFLQRNATGVALFDRCTKETPPLDFTIERGPEATVTGLLKNRTDETFENAWLVTQTGVYFLDRMSPGETSIEPWYRREHARPVVQRQRAHARILPHHWLQSLSRLQR